MDCSFCCDFPKLEPVIVSLKYSTSRDPDGIGSTGLRDFLLPRGGMLNLPVSTPSFGSQNYNGTPFGPENEGSVDESFYAEGRKCVNPNPPPDELPLADLPCVYEYTQTLELTGAAGNYNNAPDDPCYDWSVFDISVNYGNVRSAHYNNPCIEGKSCHPVEGLSDWSEEYNYECNKESEPGTPSQCHPPYDIFYPTSSINPPTRIREVIHVPVPDINRNFKEAFFADLKWKEQGEYTVPETQPFPVASMIRDKRDGRITGLQTVVTFKFKPTFSCYVKIWSRILIYDITMSGDPLTCTPSVKSEEPIIKDMPDFVWLGSGDTCYSDQYLEFKYPFRFSGDEKEEDGLVTFVKKDEGSDEIAYPEDLNQVTTGFGREAWMEIKVSYIEGYEPAWGCESVYGDCNGFYVKYLPPENVPYPS